MTLKRLEIFVIVTIIGLIGIIYALTQKPVLAPTNKTTATQDDTLTNLPKGQTSIRPEDGSPAPNEGQASTTTIEYRGEDGKNALELLKAGHQVETTHYSFGDLVTKIDGVGVDSKHFWALYVNGNFSQVGAASVVTKSSDLIRWEIDAVVDTTK